MSAGQKIRRLVTADDQHGRSYAVADGPCEDELRDPARPGFRTVRIWATDRTPAAPLTQEQVARLPSHLVPPEGGGLFRVVTIPPDSAWLGGMRPEAARDFFAAAGAAQAWCGADAPHPYMQQTRTLDLCVVLEGEVTLVLDTAQVPLAEGDTVVQRATRHAWSNRSGRPAVVAISSHDAQRPGP
jgi:hypothetical protein